MDIKNMIHTMNMIAELARRKNINAAVSIHDLNLASIFCDKFLFLRNRKGFSMVPGRKSSPEKICWMCIVSTPRLLKLTGILISVF